MILSFRLRGNVRRWILILLWFALPWAITFGLQLFGESVPQSVRRGTLDAVATSSFLMCALGGVTLIFLARVRLLPRFLIGFLAAFSLLVGLNWPHYLCGPEFVQAPAEPQQQTHAKTEMPKSSVSAAKPGVSCS